MQTLTRRGDGDAAAGLGLHFLHMSEDPFSHDAGHMLVVTVLLDKVVAQNKKSTFLAGVVLQTKIL